MFGSVTLPVRYAAMLCAAQLWVGCAAADSANSPVRSLAASCAACHGTDGHAVAGPGSMQLAGLAKVEFVRRMHVLRDGVQDADVMQQIAKGYTDAQIDALGEFFSAQSGAAP